MNNPSNHSHWELLLHSHKSCTHLLLNLWLRARVNGQPKIMKQGTASSVVRISLAPDLRQLLVPLNQKPAPVPSFVWELAQTCFISYLTRAELSNLHSFYSICKLLMVQKCIPQTLLCIPVREILSISLFL